MKLSYIAAALGALTILGACASAPPTFGDEIRASDFGDLANDWDRANRDEREARDKVDDAERKITRGENTVREARRDLRRGEEMIEEGQSDLRRRQNQLADAVEHRENVEARYHAAQQRNEDIVAE